LKKKLSFLKKVLEFLVFLCFISKKMVLIEFWILWTQQKGKILKERKGKNEGRIRKI